MVGIVLAQLCTLDDRIHRLAEQWKAANSNQCDQDDQYGLVVTLRGLLEHRKTVIQSKSGIHALSGSCDILSV